MLVTSFRERSICPHLGAQMCIPNKHLGLWMAMNIGHVVYLSLLVYIHSEKINIAS